MNTKWLRRACIILDLLIIGAMGLVSVVVAMDGNNLPVMWQRADICANLITIIILICVAYELKVGDETQP